MQIYYGIANYKIDVTNVCLQRLICNDAIEIPSGSTNRDDYFTDPLYGVHKSIFIIKDDNIMGVYDESFNVKINLMDNTITTTNEGGGWDPCCHNFFEWKKINVNNPDIGNQ